MGGIGQAPAGLGDACRRLAENTFVGYAADGLPVAGSLDLAAVASNRPNSLVNTYSFPTRDPATNGPAVIRPS
mgnify:CR=1 FL=1